jgi:hypothetical protein
LWDDLAGRPAAPTVAVLTDVGNDLMYGASIEQIVGWLTICLERLAAAGAKVAMTRLPLGSLQRLRPHRYRLLRRLLFPQNQTPLETALEQANDLDQRVEALGRLHFAALVHLPAAWYGLDPIHIRRRQRKVAWREILAPLGGGTTTTLAPLSWRERFYLSRLPPHERSIGDRTQRSVQPAGQLADGTTVSLY